MKNGKVIQFVKNHYVGILSVVVVVVFACVGIYRCSKSIPISLNATRNRISVVIESPFADGVKPNKK